MAYIAPNSEIYLYNNIEFDNSYNDTMWFNNATEQNTYFTTNKEPKYSFTAQQYTRTARDKIRVDKLADNLYDINYMRFRNRRLSMDASSDKWFYAFITDVIYINERVTELTFEIDVMQTYLFDIIIEDSFVVRQHATSDNMFENLMREDLDCGDYYDVVNSADINEGEAGRASSSVLKKNPDKFLIMTSKVQAPGIFWDKLEIPAASIINNIPNTLGLKTYNMDANGLSQYMSYVAGSSLNNRFDGDNLINAFCYPSELDAIIPDGAIINNGPETTLPLIAEAQSVSGTLTPPAMPLTFGGYTPHNYKLYAYPYNLLCLSNYQGDTMEYKYEQFPHLNGVPNVQFITRGTLLPEPMYLCAPENYRGMPIDFDSAIPLTNYPTMPLTKDGFISWESQNRNSLLINALGIIPMAGGTLMMSSLADGFAKSMMMYSAASGIYKGLFNTLGSYMDAERMPNSIAGRFAGSGIIGGIYRFQFVVEQLQIKPEYARAIDTYFDMYGYRMNRVMPVNRSSRPLWNYVQTSKCALRNSHTNLTPIDGADSSVLSKVQQIYDKGITFWKNVVGLNIGDYSRAAENSLHYTP